MNRIETSIAIHEVIRIDGMHCASCVAALTRSIGSVPGVADVVVSLESSTAQIALETEVDRDAVMDAVAHSVEQAGDYQIGDRDGGSTSSSHSNATLRADDAMTLTTISGPQTNAARDRFRLATYKPLMILIAYCIGGSLIAIFANGTNQWSFAMRIFMGLFFVSFSFLKMIDLGGFARAFRSYDVVAKRWPAYGYVYPVIELGLGVAYLLSLGPIATNVITLIVMIIGTVGVVNAVMRKAEIQCGCMGTTFDLPMSTVTIIENVSMAVMAAAMLGLSS
ncbi:MAG: MauE/DoxX family redox-associated membrane protein [Planctomycetota bacterium]